MHILSHTLTRFHRLFCALTPFRHHLVQNPGDMMLTSLYFACSCCDVRLSRYPYSIDLELGPHWLPVDPVVTG